MNLILAKDKLDKEVLLLKGKIYKKDMKSVIKSFVKLLKNYEIEVFLTDILVLYYRIKYDIGFEKVFITQEYHDFGYDAFLIQSEGKANENKLLCVQISGDKKTKVV